MLEVGAETSIKGNCRPFVVEQPSVRSADIHHGLDREHHTFAQTGTVSARAVIGHLRFLVEAGSNSVPHELANHAEPVSFDHFLYGRAYVPNRAADTRRLDRALQRGLCHIEQLLDLRLDMIANRNGDCGIRIVAIEHYSAIDRYNIPLFQQTLLRGNAMHDLLIYRSA